MKFVVGENGRNPEKNLPRPRFVHHETHMEGPRRKLGTPAVGGERLTACATRPPFPDLRRFRVQSGIELGISGTAVRYVNQYATEEENWGK